MPIQASRYSLNMLWKFQLEYSASRAGFDKGQLSAVTGGKLTRDGQPKA